MRTNSRVAAWLWVLVCGCGDAGEPPLGVTHQPVEAAQHGVFYQVAFSPARTLTAIANSLPSKTADEQRQAYVRELGALALPYWSSGSITIPALTALNGSVVMAPAPASSRIRYSCGATLISPSYVLTAGHCPTADTKLDELELQMYRPTEKLATSWQKTVTLSGAWPQLSHPQLDEADGYIVDRYPCTVKTRCYDDDVACQNSGSDVAVLECAGRPGDKYGFINVSTSSPSGKEALMHWKHEVLEVNTAEPIPSDYLEHYVKYPPTPDQNYHYFESGNQLLALRSIPWPDGSPTVFLNATQVDVHGCHGSSGSGVLAREGSTNEYRLVGPAATGGAGLSGRLCEQVPNPGGAATGRGTYALGVSFANPQKLLDQYASAISADCKGRSDDSARDVEGFPVSPGTHRVSTLFSFLSCQIDAFARDGSVPASPTFGPYPEKLVDDTLVVERVVKGFSLDAGADYRVALQAQSIGTCADCPSPELRVGNVSGSAAPLDAGLTLVSLTFAAEQAGPTEVRVLNAGTKLAVGGLTLIREGQLNTFDTPEDRLEAALYALDAERDVLVGPAPMRFAGDGSAAFKAQLFRGERMALLRQALGPGHRWTVRLAGSNLDSLTCGLLGLAGAPVIEAPCASLLSLDDRAGTLARLGFFIELPSGSEVESADIRLVALASDSARDPDADQIPEVLDNCPGDWNASQGACAEEPPTTDGGAGAGGAGGSTGAAGDGGASPSETEGGSLSDPDGGASAETGGAVPAAEGGAKAHAGSGSGAGASGGTPSGGSDVGGEGGHDKGAAPQAESACDCTVAGGANGASPTTLVVSLALLGTALTRRRRPLVTEQPSQPAQR